MKAMINGLFLLICLFSSSWIGDKFLTAENTTIESKQHIIAELTCQAPPHCTQSGKVIDTEEPVYKKHFGENEEVWVAVNPKIGNRNYAGKKARIFIVHHKPKNQWLNRTALEDVSGGFEIIKIQSDCANGNYVRIWNNPKIRDDGYDVVVDFRPFSKYNKGKDILAGFYEEGFFVSKLWISLESIAYNHDPTCHDCDAINIRQNFIEEVHIPEWNRGKSYPAAFIKDRYVTIKTVFSASPGIETARIGAVGKEGDFGDLEEEHVYFKKNGRSCPVYFSILAKTGDEIKTFDQRWEWYYLDINGTGSSKMKIRHSKNKIYILLAEPQAPWTTTGQSEPWVDVLEKSCTWAREETTQEGAAKKISQHLYNDIGGKYDIIKGDPKYTGSFDEDFDLSRFMDALPRVKYVNCYDMGKALVTFSNAVGCCLQYKESFSLQDDFKFKLNCIKPIGKLKYCRLHFARHAFASFFDRIFDASLKVYISPKQPRWMVNKSWKCYKKKLVKKGQIGTPETYPFRIGIIEKVKITKFFKKRLESAMEKYDYKNWQVETGKVIPGINIISKILKEIVPTFKMNKVWENDIYSIEKIKNNTFPIIHKYWQSGREELDITMVVGPKMDAVKEYLIFSYANMSGVPDSIEKLEIGSVCYKTKHNQEDNYLAIDFIRDNILLMMRAEGSIKKKLTKIARKLDDFIDKGSPSEEKIVIIDFYSKKQCIKLGERVRLYLEFKPRKKKPRCLWEMSGGGIEKDCKNNFIYYGGDVGRHKITLYVIDDIGNYDISSLEIEVVSNLMQRSN